MVVRRFLHCSLLFCAQPVIFYDALSALTREVLSFGSFYSVATTMRARLNSIQHRKSYQEKDALLACLLPSCSAPSKPCRCCFPNHTAERRASLDSTRFDSIRPSSATLSTPCSSWSQPTPVPLAPLSDFDSWLCLTCDRQRDILAHSQPLIMCAPKSLWCYRIAYVRIATGLRRTEPCPNQACIALSCSPRSSCHSWAVTVLPLSLPNPVPPVTLLSPLTSFPAAVHRHLHLARIPSLLPFFRSFFLPFHLIHLSPVESLSFRPFLLIEPR